MTLIIFEDDGWRNLLPLVYWRTCGELRTGYSSLIDHIRVAAASADLRLYCRPELAAVSAERLACPVNTIPDVETACLVNSRALLTSPVQSGPAPGAQWLNGTPIVVRADRALLERLTPDVFLDPEELSRALAGVPEAVFSPEARLMRYPWDLVQSNPDMLQLGWKRAGEPAEILGRLTEGVYLLNRSAIHIGVGSTIKPGVVLDAENGPIYIGENVTISPNVSIEGPCFIGDGSLIQPGAALRDGMSIGRRCKVGGELESSILHGFSNKQHDGFLGHSYVAEWVNLAADTVSSDLKNTYGNIRVAINGVDVESGLMFVGATVGDHSKTGIGQMLPTGAVIGFGCNVATCEFAPRFVQSFVWLTAKGRSRYDIERCLEVAKRVMARRQIVTSFAEQTLFKTVAGLAEQIETPLPCDD